MPDLLTDASGRGYADPAYAASLRHIGTPVVLPLSGGSLVSRSIPNSTQHDLMMPYPLFTVANWAQLASDFANLDSDWVSISAVIDPMTAPPKSVLEQAFPDLLKEYKQHQVVDLSLPVHATLDSTHARKARKALKTVVVERADDATALAGTWISLYDNLVQRHEIEGPAAFSAESFERQLALAGMDAWTGSIDGHVVSMILCLVAGSNVYYHLGAHSDEGYAANASFALFHEVVAHYAERGLAWFDLGAGAGGTSDGSDGLTRFKKGWATGTKPAYLAGRVLNSSVYEQLTVDAETLYFPAYRS